MKKTLTLILSLLLLLSLCACGASETPAQTAEAGGAFDPAAAAGTYSCLLRNLGSEDADPTGCFLVIDPNGDSRFFDGETEHALQAIDWNSGLVGVEDRVYTLTDNRDGTLTLIAQDESERYLFALATLPGEESDGTDLSAVPAEALDGPDPLAGRYIGVAMVFGDAVYDRAYMEQMAAEGTAYLLTLNADGSGEFRVGEESFPIHSRDRVTGQLDVGYTLTPNNDGTVSMVRSDGGMELTLAPID